MDDDLTVTTLADRPDLRPLLWEMPDSWPAFMLQDLVAHATLGRLVDEFPEFTLVATDPAGQLVARGLSVPFLLGTPRRGTLPDRGWDQVVLWALHDRIRGDRPDTVTALEIAIRPDRQGTGLSTRLVAAMRANAAAHGFTELVAPVRPSAKHLEPGTPMPEYAARVREADGLPEDPWLRVHVRAGAVIERVCPVAMTVAGSLAEWRAWTGLPFDASGEVLVPGALAPVRCDPERDQAVYVEPNVWLRHRL
ncbi:N-acetyltransferase [Kitasatospora sp. NPDC058965]|uniref:N-acetyltransferase n=1 Tax=Kitasatospora sp. NPDC058965 TaxID=3346682 RepID=UPI0036BCAB0F